MADLKRPDVTPNRRPGLIKISAATLLLAYAVFASVLFFWPDGEQVRLAMIRLWYGATELGLPDWVSPGVFSALSNAVAFMLPPIVLSVLAPRVPWWIWSLFSLLASVVIELLQMTVLPAREPTLHDVAANSLGGLLGALLGRGLVRLVGRGNPVARTS